MLSVGKSLIIPNSGDQNNSNDIYIVKAGDSLYRIAREFDLSVDEIIKLNNLTNTILSIGQKLKIPAKKEEIEPSTNNKYIVKKGDTLYKIAKEFNISIDEIINTNNLQNSTLSIGQSLIIPGKTYVVKKGDTLYKIAKEFNTSINELAELNNLKGNTLSIGQILKIK